MIPGGKGNGKRPLKAIFFDIDDTLYSTSDFAQKARANSVEAMIKTGLNMAKEDLLRELLEVIDEFSSNYDRHFDKLLLRIPAKSYQNINRAIIIAAGIIAYHQTKFQHLVPFEDVTEVLKILSKSDLIRGVITSGLEIKQAEKLLRLNLYQYLSPQAIFISDQIGISKPNAKLYLRASTELGIPIHECMYVGDNPLLDIDPPNRLGMVTVWARRGKHSQIEGQTRPDYDIQNFRELLNIIRTEFEVKLPAAEVTTPKDSSSCI